MVYFLVRNWIESSSRKAARCLFSVNHERLCLTLILTCRPGMNPACYPSFGELEPGIKRLSNFAADLEERDTGSDHKLPAEMSSLKVLE